MFLTDFLLSSVRGLHVVVFFKGTEPASSKTGLADENQGKKKLQQSPYVPRNAVSPTPTALLSKTEPRRLLCFFLPQMESGCSPARACVFTTRRGGGGAF
jgi:hypothetical protein